MFVSFSRCAKAAVERRTYYEAHRLPVVSRQGEYLEVNIENEAIVIAKTAPPEKANDKTLTEKINESTPKQKKELSKYIDSLKT